MPFRKRSSSVEFIRPIFDFTEVETLYSQAADGRREANEIEKIAKSLVDNGFPEAASHEFMLAVVSWGRGNRFLDRAKTQNTPGQVASALRAANDHISNGDIARAVDAVAQMRYVGHSFASKHVRMMCPDKAGTLDSRIRDRLGYAGNAEGYGAFLADLEHLKTLISESDHVPRNLRDRLRICDVEMIVYAALEKK